MQTRWQSTLEVAADLAFSGLDHGVGHLVSMTAPENH